jgi:hypothetical protein
MKPKNPKYWYEVWVSCENYSVDTEMFPATAEGFAQAFKAADDMTEVSDEVLVYVHRWDFTERSTFARYKSDEGFAFVNFDDDGAPESIATELTDDDGLFLNKLPKAIVEAFGKGRKAYMEA